MAKKKATSASKSVGKPASKTKGKASAKPAAKPASSPARAPSSKTGTSGTGKAKGKPASARSSKPTAKPSASAQKGPAKAVPKAAKPAQPTQVETPAQTKSQAPRVKKAAAASLDASGRPASKPHLHAAGDAPQPAPGRARKDASGPTHAGVGDAAVRKATGEGWDHWFALLDGAGATKMDHAAIASLLEGTHGVEPWWSQTITVGYEQARGMRQKHETPDGFQAGVSKTINAATAKLYHAWQDDATRAKWMGDHKVEIRVANADKNIRMTWLVQGPDEGSSVEVHFWPKDANKCLVQVQQRKLADAEAVQRVRAFWSVKLENLRAAMEKA